MSSFCKFRWSRGTLAWASLEKTLSPVSSGAMDTHSTSAVAPVSISGSMRMRVTPVSVSPLAIALWMGEAPRYLGRMEAWRLTQPCWGVVRNVSFRI